MGSTSLLSQPQLSSCFGRRGDSVGASRRCFCSARAQLRKAASVPVSLTVVSKSAKKSRFLCFAIEDEGAGSALEERPRKFLVNFDVWNGFWDVSGPSGFDLVKLVLNCLFLWGKGVDSDQESLLYPISMVTPYHHSYYHFKEKAILSISFLWLKQLLWISFLVLVGWEV